MALLISSLFIFFPFFLHYKDSEKIRQGYVRGASRAAPSPPEVRPEEYEGLKVPEVLLSGHHKKVDEWRRLQSLLITGERRPDLYEKLELSKTDQKLLKKFREESAS